MSPETIFAVGTLATPRGDFLKSWRDGSPSVLGAVPAAAFAETQPADLHVLLQHDPYFDRGHFVYLERSGGSLYAAVRVTRATRDEFAPAYFSAGLCIVGDRVVGGYTEVLSKVRHAAVDHVSIGPTRAAIGLPPVGWFERLDEHPTACRLGTATSPNERTGTSARSSAPHRCGYRSRSSSPTGTPARTAACAGARASRDRGDRALGTALASAS